ncbi:hypothetical protein J3A83DRAFT_4185937 [Scleroderma citrinum]
MDPASESASPVSLIRGPLLGTCLGSILYGVTCLQAFFYYQTYVNDLRCLKVTVAVLLTLETVHVALSIWVIDNFIVNLDSQALQSATWHALLSTLTTATFTIGVGWPFLDVSVWDGVPALSALNHRTATSCGGYGGVSGPLESHHQKTVDRILDGSYWNLTNRVLSPTWVSYLANDKSLILTANVLFIVGDVFSASIMAFHLNKSRENILRLIAFAVATGGLTVLVDIIALIFTLTEPLSLGFTGPILVQTRLYANSLLASLNLRNANARVYEFAERTSIEPTSLPLQFAHQTEQPATSAEPRHETPLRTGVPADLEAFTYSARLKKEHHSVYQVESKAGLGSLNLTFIERYVCDESEVLATSEGFQNHNVDLVVRANPVVVLGIGKDQRKHTVFL